tara:strand:+ start:66 stop:434 length:369 start_codon:yes stop_codon:yes gene_type:complete
MTLALKLIGIFSALLILLCVMVLIRQKKLTDEYATLWLFVSLLFLGGSVFANKIFKFYQFLKGDSGSGLSILLFIAIIMIMFIIIFLSSKLSIHQEQIKNLTQKIGLLDHQIRSKEDDQKNS